MSSSSKLTRRLKEQGCLISVKKGIERVGERGGKGKGREEERRSFARWARYFNGRTSMERIALLEGVTRKEVWARITAWDEYLNVIRTW